jgi:predicted transcriptional regulator
MPIEATNGLTANTSGNPVFEYRPHVQPHAPVVTTAPAQDTAVLSITAQATLLQQQGLSVNEIAEQLGLATSVVQADLGIATTVQTEAAPLTKSATA